MSGLLLHPRVEGIIRVVDRDSGEVMLDHRNAIHFANMAEALALSLANRSRGHIHGMEFGNGGSVVNGVGAITYLPPNVSGQDAALHNATYRKVVDDLSPRNADAERNLMRVEHTADQTFADVVATCTLDYAEPADQESFDDATSFDQDRREARFVFDELGLRGFDPNAPGGYGRLLTHAVFSPVQKALNRSFEITYTLRIALA